MRKLLEGLFDSGKLVSRRKAQQKLWRRSPLVRDFSMRDQVVLDCIGIVGPNGAGKKQPF